MNEPSVAKSVTIKLLTIIGFGATIALLVWLIVLGAKNAPGGFASLANIAKGLDAYKTDTLVLTTAETVVNSGDSFQVSWNPMRREGSYMFGYQCSDGISLSVREADGSLTPFNCTESLSLVSTTKDVFVQVTSKAQRFSDVTLTLVFTPKEEGEKKESKLKMTVMNAKIPVGATVKPEAPKPAPPKLEPETPKAPEVPKETPAPTVPEDTIPTPKPVSNSPYPVSDPNGFTDLEVKVLSVGTQVNGVYMPQEQFMSGTRGAIRFDVKNVGTKRSGSWTFSVSLPNEQGYTSVAQMPLGPQEHIESTLGFDLGDTKTPATVIVTIFPTADTNAGNNSITKSVTVN